MPTMSEKDYQEWRRAHPGRAKAVDAARADARQQSSGPKYLAAQIAAVLDPQTAGGANKYHAKPVVIDGIRFASTKEGNRYSELCLMQKAGEILWFARQARFKIEGGEYVADWIIAYPNHCQWADCDAPPIVVEDTKGMITPVYRRSKKQMLERYGIDIKES